MHYKDYRILRNSGEIIYGLRMYTVWTKPRVFFIYCISEIKTLLIKTKYKSAFLKYKYGFMS